MAKSKPTLSKPINPIETVYLRCADEGENHYKFWAAWVASEGYIYVEYGRIGRKQPSVHVYECGTVSAAQNKLRSLISEKSRKGYEPGKPPTQQDSLNYAALGSVAADIQQQIAQIQSRFDTIKPYTSIEFDVQRGMFISQCGAITPQAIAQAREALARVAQHQGISDSRFAESVLNYIQLVPMPVGRKLNTSELLGTSGKVIQQEQVLETLNWALDQIAQVRQLIQTALTNLTQAEKQDRSTWVIWGDIESIPTDPPNPTRYTDDRALGVIWE